MDDGWINRAVGAELRAARARQGWSREQLDQVSGVSPATLRRYEDGSRSVPVDTLITLLAALKLTIVDVDKAIREARPTGDPPSSAEPPAQPRGRDANQVQNRIPRPANLRKRGKNESGVSE